MHILITWNLTIQALMIKHLLNCVTVIINTWIQNTIYYIYCFVCLSACVFVCLFVCLSVCLSAPRNFRGLKSYDHEIWHVGPLSDRKPLRSFRILIFGRRPFLWAQTPFFIYFFLFVQRLRVVSSSNLESRISGWFPNMWNHQMFQKSILVPGCVIIFGAIWAQTPLFGLFYLKSYDDEIWYVQ